MIIRTFDGLQALTTPARRWASPSPNSLNLYGLNQAYAKIYETQPNVRICVDFLARNIAQLAPQVFRRISDTDRARLTDHDLARWLGKPNPSTRRYRLIENLVGDLGVYFEAYLLKVRYAQADGRPAIGLVGLPPDEMDVLGGLLPTSFVWTNSAGKKDFPLSEIAFFNGYNPGNRKRGLAPLETLRRILAEEAAAGDHREAFWRNASKQEGVWELAKDAPDWKTKDQQDSWRDQWQQFASSAKAGMTALGPKGGTYKPTSFSAKDSEYTVGGKLRREVVAAAYHIPLPLVGILEHATFSNIKEQHKHLYQDCLGPWLEMIQQEIEGQLLIECEDQENVYVEFNIDAKLAGTPEERAASLRLAIGRPWVTVNEGRALENRPRIDDPELDTVAPQQGGPADATANPGGAAADPGGPTPPAAINVAPVIQAAQARQQARLGKLPIAERAAAFDLDRWNRELTEDLIPLVGEDEAARLASALNGDTLARLEQDALRVRIEALEARPTAQHIEVHPAAVSAPITVMPPSSASDKTITTRRDAAGAVVGFDVRETR